MAQSFHWLLRLLLDMSDFWELTSWTLPPALAHTLGQAQLYRSSKVNSWVVAWVAVPSVLQQTHLLRGE